MNKFSNNDLVSYDMRDGHMVGRARVIGVATIGQPLIGPSYILQDLSENVPNETYPYSAFVAFEYMLEKIL